MTKKKNVFINKIRILFSEDGSAVKAGIYYFICQILVSGLSFISTPIFSRVMDKTSYGLFSNFAAWESILIPIVTLNLRQTVAKSKYDYPDKNDTFISSILALSSTVTVLFYIIIEFNKAYFIQFFNMDIQYIRILFFYLLLSPAFLYQQLQYRIYNKYKLFVFYSILSTFVRMGLSVVLVLIMDDKFAGRVYGYVIPAVILYLIIYISIWKRGKRIDPDCCKYALGRAIPLIPAALSSTLLTSSDQIMITEFCGSDQTALYVIAYSVSSIASVIWNAMSHAWGPWFYDRLDAEKFDDIKENSQKYQWGYAFIMSCVMLIEPEIVLIMGGRAYQETIWVMPPVVLAMICQFYYSFYFNVEYFYGKMYVISIGTILAAATNLVLNFIFIPQFGYIAAAYTTLVGYLVMVIYHFSIVKFVLKKSFVYDNKQFLKTFLLLTVVQIIVAALYLNIVVRYIIIAIYAMIILRVVWKKRAEIIAIVQNNVLKKK